MYTRDEHREAQPFKGARVTGSLHMTIQTAVLIETFQALGAQVRWCSCNIYSTQDHAAAAIVQAKTAAVYAWKEETLEEYWWCTLKALVWPNNEGPTLIVDDGGDMTLFVHEGFKLEKEYEKTSTLIDVSQVSNKEMKIVYNVLNEFIPNHPGFFANLVENLVGISEETTTGVLRLEKMAKKKELLVPAINVNDSVTKSKFDNIYGCRHSLPDSIMRATDVMIAGKKVLILGYGDVGKGCAAAMKGCGARVYVTEVDPICALQACMEGLHVVKIETVVSTADIFVTCTGDKDIILTKHMEKMKNNAIVCNIGHFDNEVDTDGLKNYKDIKVVNIKPQVDRYIFPDGHGILLLADGRLVNLGCATGHPSFVMSNSFTNQIMAQLELWENKENNKYDNDVYVLPKELDEKVARLHLKALGAELTELSEDQADYISVKVEGPYKKSTYKY